MGNDAPVKRGQLQGCSTRRSLKERDLSQEAWVFGWPILVGSASRLAYLDVCHSSHQTNIGAAFTPPVDEIPFTEDECRIRGKLPPVYLTDHE